MVKSLTLAALLWSVGALAATAQQVESWVTTLGKDTVAFERFTRSAGRLEGEFVVTTPRGRLNQYLVTFNPDGSVKQYDFSGKALVDGPGSQPAVQATALFGAGEVVLTVFRGGKVDTVRMAAGSPALPNAVYSWGLFGLATEAARRLRKDSVVVEQVAVGGRQTTKTSVVRRRDSLAVDFFGSPMMAKLDPRGRLVGVSGGRTTLKVRARRVARLDLPALAEAFAARERAGQAVGVLSPRDTVLAAVQGQEIWIDYGRPARRGRRILGDVVPLGQVWRTGANAATQVRFGRDMEVGGLAVPAGLYTLWTLPTAGKAALIINKKTGQWGTEYDPTQDLGRVDLETRPLEPEAERFTISVVEVGGAAELRFDWDRFRWAVRLVPR